MDKDKIGLCTFPDDDECYCKHFEIPKNWLIDVLNERLEDFLDRYTWDETWFIYEMAKANNVLICENEVE